MIGRMKQEGKLGLCRLKGKASIKFKKKISYAKRNYNPNRALSQINFFVELFVILALSRKSSFSKKFL